MNRLVPRILWILFRLPRTAEAKNFRLLREARTNGETVQSIYPNLGLPLAWRCTSSLMSLSSLETWQSTWSDALEGIRAISSLLDIQRIDRTAHEMYSGYDRSPSATPSRSSSTSAHSWNGYRDSQQPMQGDVPTAVHNLLASTKRLQSILEEWSQGQADEKEVSDVYVQIGTELNVVITAFAYHQIDLSDIHSTVPQEMRDVLERCLAEDPSPQTLARYMPELKTILIKLLRGLHNRQETWQARTSTSNHSSPRNSR
ncbi:hypothetical protein NMY22_g11863 [Coprinellus aureogranulatus]|nr:hypothetical protein NMY22_g11863 [Coprinellus aureogranulatus]